MCRYYYLLHKAILSCIYYYYYCYYCYYHTYHQYVDTQPNYNNNSKFCFFLLPKILFSSYMFSAIQSLKGHPLFEARGLVGGRLQQNSSHTIQFYTPPPPFLLHIQYCTTYCTVYKLLRIIFYCNFLDMKKGKKPLLS